jgi:Spy/CpxP family protein refolding chaperone
MNARFAHVLSRLSIVSVVAVSALGATACNNSAPASTTPAVAEAPQAAEGRAAPVATAGHHPGQQIFREVQALDLRDDQRAAVTDLEQNLVADLAPHRETFRQAAQFLADGVESGELDADAAKAQQAAIAAAILDGKASFIGAMNGLHDVLDADQRATLVARLAEMHRRGVTRDAQGAERPDGPLSKLAFQLGLSEQQKAGLRDAVQQGVDEIFPDHAARREASEARMKAIAAAFVLDDFDAADHDLGEGPERSLASFGEIVNRTVDVSGRLFSTSQRAVLASLIRSHAEKI